VKIQSRRVLDELLNDEEPCLGAVFCTFAFDPRFFEEQMLRVLLRLRSDPEEHASTFHEEARRALQECPVAVILDARVRQAGRRLPYDQLLVRSRVFHPKLVLALYAEHARVLIGSANLTRGGYDENLELVIARTLRYGEAAHTAELREIDRFVAGCAELASASGTQLRLVREELARRLGPDAPEDAPRDHALLSSLDRPILDQLFERVPDDASITRIGVLAPFYERDDEEAAQSEGVGTFLAALLERRKARDLVIDLATGWDDAPVLPDAGSIASLGGGLDHLWAWRWIEESGDQRKEGVAYFVPTAIKERKVAYRAADGSSRREDRNLFEEAVAERRMWPVRPPQLHLPMQLIEHLRSKYDLRLWMQPAAQLDDRARIQRRPLHAKLFLLTTKRRGRERTWILFGSPNASRGAMLWSLEEGGNVELAVLVCVDQALTLIDVLPSLVHVDSTQAELVERQMPEPEPDLGAWINDAVHSPSARDLVIEWANDGPAPLGTWKLMYEGRELASGAGVPSAPTRAENFDLLASSAELELISRERSYPVPIRVSDLAELPTMAALAQLDLRELLALHGRRIGAERLATIISERGQAGAESVLESIFGSGFGPIDVFKAWWGIAHDLAQPISVPAFRHRLRGPMGVAIVWERLRAEVDRGVSPDEVWIYGCELLLALRSIVLPQGADRDAKLALVAELIGVLESSIASMRPPSEGRPWLGSVVRFYTEDPARA
jgi:hypothetical protein